MSDTCILVSFDPDAGCGGLFTATREDLFNYTEKSGVDPGFFKIIYLQDQSLEELIDSFGVDRRIDYRTVPITLMGFNPIEENFSINNA